jgi:hypothetical protein
MTSLIDLLTPRYAPIQSFIISCLDIGDIVALTRTCRALTGNYSTSKALKFDINILLKIWFQDPCAFRSVQGQCHALKIDLIPHYIERASKSARSLPYKP